MSLKPKYVRIQIPDTYGRMRGVYITMDHLEKHAEKGVPIAIIGVIGGTSSKEFIDGTEMGFETGFPDAFFYPDFNTLRMHPEFPHKASVFGSFRILSNNPESQSVATCTRGILMRALKELNDMGLSIYASFEYEFCLFLKDSTELAATSAALMTHSYQMRYETLVEEIMDNLEKCGMKPERFHLESTASKFEITCQPSFDIDVADNASRFKQIVREVCEKHGYEASFMSKPFSTSELSSGHFNHSIWTHDRVNVFHDLNKPYKISDFTRYWLAGLQYHFKALSCLAASTINGYDNFIVSEFKPFNGWGIDNRNVSLRMRNMDAERTYCEYRDSGAGTNPYLMTAAIIFAGLHGVQNKMKLNQEFPIEGKVDMAKEDESKCFVPESYRDALESLNNDELFKEKLGEKFLKVYSKLRNHEITTYEKEKQLGNHWEWQRKQFKFL